MSQLTRQPIKRHGGKKYLKKWIISLMPQRAKKPNKADDDDPGWLLYVEPYFGGGAVLLANDPQGISEVVNDIDRELTNFWKVLRSPEKFVELQRWLTFTPFSEVEFAEAFNPDGDDVERAAKLFIRSRQSRQAHGKGFATPVKKRTRRDMNEHVSAWLSAIEGLPEVHARLQRVEILASRPALDVIRQHDGPRTLFYLDPPYLHSTRSTTGEYAHEMTDAQHRELLETLAGIKGRFMLSGYPSEMYDEWADRHGWQCHECEIDNKASGAKEKGIKLVMSNFKCDSFDASSVGRF